MAEWTTVPLGSLGAEGRSAYATGPFGSAVSAKYFQESGIPMIRGSNLSDDVGVRMDESELVFVSEELASDYARSIVVPGDLIFTCWGTIGQVGLVDDSARHPHYIVSNKQMKMTPEPTKVSPLFLYYYLSQRSMIRLMQGQSIGSSVPGFNLGQLKSLPVTLPGLSEQRSISEVLGALDNKIAANDRISRLTDELLSAMYARVSRSASLGCLADIARVNVATTRPQPGGRLRYLDISAVSVGGYEMPDPMDWAEAPGRARRVVRAGDTVWSTVRPNRRSHALILDESEELVASTGLAVITPHAGRIASAYESGRTEAFVQYLESVSEGSAYPAVRGERFLDAPVPKLEPEVWDEFEAVALPMRRRVDAAMRESRALAQTRDELLPLLMSGGIRVRDAEKVVEEVT